MAHRTHKTSDLGFALLGLLARGSATGYDLSARLARPVGYFWSARHSQVYPELARLEDAGLVSHEEVDGRGPRQSKRYALTPEGRAALAAWVTEVPAPRPVKDPLVLRIYSLWVADPQAASAMVETLRAERAALLERYLAEEQAIMAAGVPLATTSPRFGNLAAVRAGIGHERHMLAWLDWLRGALAAGEALPPG